MKKEQFLEDFAKQLDYWVKEAVKSSVDEETDLKWSERAQAFRAFQAAVTNGAITQKNLQEVFEEVLRGFAVSIFTVIDGGTEFADEERVSLVGESGDSYGELHDEFVMHLIKTGRLQ